MARNHYSEISQYYIRLAVQCPELDRLPDDCSPQMHETAKAVIAGLSEHKRRLLESTIDKREKRETIHNPKAYRLIDEVNKTFAQQAGLI